MAKIKTTNSLIIYDNDGYKLSFNKYSSVITEIQDGILTSKINKINNKEDLIKIKNDFYGEWEYIGFIAGETEEKFFQKVENFIK